jgi:signal transduction histidine kinase
MSAYRIIQEALTNIRKHAGVTSAEVSIDYAERGLDIVVADRGRGASASLAMAAGRDGLPDAGHGLLGMRERAALVGGELLAGPQSGGGWIVRARLPYEGRGA